MPVAPTSAARRALSSSEASGRSESSIRRDTHVAAAVAANCPELQRRAGFDAGRATGRTMRVPARSGAASDRIRPTTRPGDEHTISIDRATEVCPRNQAVSRLRALLCPVPAAPFHVARTLPGSAGLPDTGRFGRTASHPVRDHHERRDEKVPKPSSTHLEVD